MNAHGQMMNVNTGLFLQDLVFVPQVHKSVQCTFAVLQGQPRVLEVVFREQVVLQLQRSAYKAEEFKRNSSRTTILAKVS